MISTRRPIYRNSHVTGSVAFAATSHNTTSTSTNSNCMYDDDDHLEAIIFSGRSSRTPHLAQTRCRPSLATNRRQLQFQQQQQQQQQQRPSLQRPTLQRAPAPFRGLDPSLLTRMSLSKDDSMLDSLCSSRMFHEPNPSDDDDDDDSSAEGQDDDFSQYQYSLGAPSCLNETSFRRGVDRTDSLDSMAGFAHQNLAHYSYLKAASGYFSPVQDDIREGNEFGDDDDEEEDEYDYVYQKPKLTRDNVLGSLLEQVEDSKNKTKRVLEDKPPSVINICTEKQRRQHNRLLLGYEDNDDDKDEAVEEVELNLQRRHRKMHPTKAKTKQQQQQQQQQPQPEKKVLGKPSKVTGWFKNKLSVIHPKIATVDMSSTSNTSQSSMNDSSHENQCRRRKTTKAKNKANRDNRRQHLQKTVSEMRRASF